MEKTIIALLALGSVAMAATSKHDVSFVDQPSGAFHTWASDPATLSITNYHITSSTFGNGSKGTVFGGLYVESEGGLKFNIGSDEGKFVTLNYLYLDSSIVLGTGTGAAGEVAWSNNTGAHFKINDGGWVDVNASYNRIDVSNMTSGSIFLNDAGSLTLSALGNGVAVHANVTAGEERTLITGDMSNWAGSMALTAGNSIALVEGGQLMWATGELVNIKINATAEGLSYSFETPAVPEPTTATLSLLALAGLAARRRRK